MNNPWDDSQTSQQHLTNCREDFCERCAWLIDGFYMSCDQCGHWGQQESDGWTLCRAMVFCNRRCADLHFGCDSSEFSETEPLTNNQSP